MICFSLLHAREEVSGSGALPFPFPRLKCCKSRVLLSPFRAVVRTRATSSPSFFPPAYKEKEFYRPPLPLFFVPFSLFPPRFSYTRYGWIRLFLFSLPDYIRAHFFPPPSSFTALITPRLRSTPSLPPQLGQTATSGPSACFPFPSWSALIQPVFSFFVPVAAHQRGFFFFSPFFPTV